MVIGIKLWGQLRNLAGQERLDVEVQAGSSIEDVVKNLATVSNEKLSAILLNEDGTCRHSTLVFVNDQQISWDEPQLVNEGASITLMSPIAGG